MFSVSLGLSVELLDLDFNVRTVDANVIPRHIAGGRRPKHLTSSNVEHRAVPRARDFSPVDLTFRERPAHVRAGVVDRVERTTYVEKRDFLAVDFDHPGPANGYLFSSGNLYKLWHWFLSLLEGRSI